MIDLTRSGGLAALTLSCITACKVAVFLVLCSSGLQRPYVGDNAANIYLPAANRLLTTGTFNDSGSLMYSSQAPGYPVFLALTKAFFGERYLAVVVCLQILVDNCVALLLLALGKRVTSIAAGFWAGVLWLVFPPAVVISTWITSETLFTALLVLSIVVWIFGLAAPRGLRLSFAAGLALGVASLIRGTTLLLPVGFFAMACLRGVSKGLVKSALLLLGMCLVVAPWTLRNLKVLGEPIVVQTGFGSFFLQGSRSEYFTIRGKLGAYPNLVREAAQDGLVKPTDAKATSHQRWLLSLGLRNYRLRMEQEPWSLLPFAAWKFGRLWYGTENGLAHRQTVLGLCSLLIVPAGALQIWRWRRSHAQLSMTLSLLVLYFVLIPLVGLPELRYVMPVYPFLTFAAVHLYAELFAPSQNPQPASVVLSSKAV
jgi:4-amino-4-deoxy-L-arabinose transferase-like glycosyltransferase